MLDSFLPSVSYNVAGLSCVLGKRARLGHDGEGEGSMGVFIAGVDGYLGWPLAMHLAKLE